MFSVASQIAAWPLRAVLPENCFNWLRNRVNLLRYKWLWRKRTVVHFECEGRQVALTIVDPDDPIQGEQRKGGFYEEQELAMLRNFVKPNSVFIDVGANTGQHGIYAILVIGVSKVVFFEPIQPACDILLENVKLNRLADRVDVSNLGVALSNRTGFANFRTNHANLGGSEILISRHGSIPLARGDDLLIGMNVGFIKIDTEGNEMEVLEGLAETIVRCRPGLFVEVDVKNERAFRELLASYDYEIVSMTKAYLENSNVVAIASRL